MNELSEPIQKAVSIFFLFCMGITYLGFVLVDWWANRDD